MPKFDTVGHVALTVTDVTRSSDFYNQVFGTETAMSTSDEGGDFALLVGPSLILGLRKHPGTGGADRFDPARVGLDHIGLHVSSRDDLEQWREHLDAQGVQHSGVIEDQFGLHLNVKDPDNIALEFFVSAL